MKEYPVELYDLLHNTYNQFLASAKSTASWRVLAEHGRDQDYVHAKMESDVRNHLAHMLTEHVVVFRDHEHPEGLQYYASLFACPKDVLFEVMYSAYKLGFKRVGELNVLKF